MLLFFILSLILLFLLAFTIIAISAGGAIFIIVFGDVIVCILLIAYLIKLVLGRGKKKNDKTKKGE